MRKYIKIGIILGAAFYVHVASAYTGGPGCQTCPPPKNPKPVSFGTGGSDDLSPTQLSTAASVAPPSGYGSGQSGWESFAQSQGATSVDNGGGSKTYSGLGATASSTTNSDGTTHYVAPANGVVSLPTGVSSWDAFGTPSGYSSWDTFNSSPSTPPPSGYSDWATWANAQ